MHSRRTGRGDTIALVLDAGQPEVRVVDDRALDVHLAARGHVVRGHAAGRRACRRRRRCSPRRRARARRRPQRRSQSESRTAILGAGPPDAGRELPGRRPRTRFGGGWRAASVALRSAGGVEPPSSSGLGRRPFKAVTRVRIPLGVRRQQDLGPVVQFGVHAGLSSRRPRVQIPSGPPSSPSGRRPPSPSGAAGHGRVAQLAERPPEKRKVTGSTPVPTTTDDQAKCLVIVRFPRPWSSATSGSTSTTSGGGWLLGRGLPGRPGCGVRRPGRHRALLIGRDPNHPVPARTTAIRTRRTAGNVCCGSDRRSGHGRRAREPDRRSTGILGRWQRDADGRHRRGAGASAVAGVLLAVGPAACGDDGTADPGGPTATTRADEASPASEL